MPSRRSRGGRGIASVCRALSILELFDALTAELGISEMGSVWTFIRVRWLGWSTLWRAAATWNRTPQRASIGWG